MAAKRALRATVCPRALFDEIDVVAAPDGAPEAFLEGWPLPVAISISHTGGGADALGACAVVADRQAALGLDLETLEPRSAAFVADFFTAREQAAVAAAATAGGEAGALWANLIWSAKESALKALRTGLREDTLAVEVELPAAPGELRDVAPGSGWAPLAARHRGGARFAGWWRRDHARVWTILCAVPIAPPRDLPAAPA